MNLNTETPLGQIYEGMFLLDNDVVRAGYTKAKSVVTDILAKHGAQLHCVRRWDERRMTYPISHRQRATYFLAYFEMPSSEQQAFRRDLDLSETIMRYLLLAVDALPEGEIEAANLEEGADFVVPEPPDDDQPEDPPIMEDEFDEDGERIIRPDKPAEEKKEEGETTEGGDAPSESDKPVDAPVAEDKPADAPAAESIREPAVVTTDEAEASKDS
jgi:small subunit ribosomal protein S6